MPVIATNSVLIRDGKKISPVAAFIEWFSNTADRHAENIAAYLEGGNVDALFGDLADCREVFESLKQIESF